MNVAIIHPTKPKDKDGRGQSAWLGTVQEIDED